MSDNDQRAALAEMVAAATADANAMTERVADELHARRAARLADPNSAPLWRALYGVQQPPRTRQRKPSVASVIGQMQRAGVEIAGCEINPRDGTVIVRTGKPSEATPPDNDDDSNEWDGVLQ